MDTVIINNHSFPVLPDSITVKTDHSLLVNHLDFLVSQNQKNLAEVQQMMWLMNEKDNYFHFISNDALFTMIITIGVFSLGLLANYISRRMGEKRKKGEIRSYVKFHLDRIITGYIDKLSERYTELSQDTNIDSEIRLTPPEVSSGDFQRILNIDQKELFYSVKQKREISNILSYVESIHHQNERVRFFHKTFLKASKEQREIINQKTQMFIASIMDFCNYNRNVLDDTPTPDAVMTYEIFDNYNKLELAEKTITRLKGDLIEPISRFFNRDDLYNKDGYVPIILERAEELLSSINTLDNQVVDFKDEYDSFASILTSTKIEFQRNMSKIRW